MPAHAPLPTTTPAAAIPPLPPGWVWTRLGVLCSKIQDGTHFSPKIQYKEPGADRYMYITAKNVRDHGIDLSELTFVDKDIHQSIFNRCNPEFGDVLLVKDGVNTGTVAINSMYEEFTLLSSVALLKPDRSIVDARYIKHYLSSPVGLSNITGQMTGTAIKRIIFEKIRIAPLPLPPLTEQRRIVEAIETQLTRLDAGVAALKAAQAKLRRYRAAVLKAACAGQLVPQNPSDEPASALLQRILAERRERWIAERRAKGKATAQARYEEPAAPNVAELPPGWVWATVEQLIELLQYGSSVKADADEEEGVVILRMGNIKDGALDYSNLKYIDPSKENIAKYRLYTGDVLINRTNSPELVGKAGLFERHGNYVFASYLIRLRFINEAISPRFATISINSEIGRNHVVKTKHQVAGQANINSQDIRSMPIPLPPLAEQRRIVTEVERRLSVVAALEATVAANLKRAERLQQAILKRAFAGKLVPQDPSDEPASALLERIRRGGARGARGAGAGLKGRRKP